MNRGGRAADLVHDPAIDIDQNRPGEIVVAWIDPHGQRGPCGMEKAEHTVRLSRLRQHVFSLAAEQHGETTNVGQLREEGFIQRERSAQRDDPGKLAGMTAGDPKRIRSASLMTHQEYPSLMDCDPVGDPFDRPPDRLVETEAAVLVAGKNRLHCDEVAETHLLHHPAEVEASTDGSLAGIGSSRCIAGIGQIRQPDEERVVVAGLVSERREESIVAEPVAGVVGLLECFRAGSHPAALTAAPRGSFRQATAHRIPRKLVMGLMGLKELMELMAAGHNPCYPMVSQGEAVCSRTSPVQQRQDRSAPPWPQVGQVGQTAKVAGAIPALLPGRNPL